MTTTCQLCGHERVVRLGHAGCSATAQIKLSKGQIYYIFLAYTRDLSTNLYCRGSVCRDPLKHRILCASPCKFTAVRTYRSWHGMSHNILCHKVTYFIHILTQPFNQNAQIKLFFCYIDLCCSLKVPVGRQVDSLMNEQSGN